VRDASGASAEIAATSRVWHPKVGPKQKLEPSVLRGTGEGVDVEPRTLSCGQS